MKNFICEKAAEAQANADFEEDYTNFELEYSSGCSASGLESEFVPSSSKKPKKIA